MLKRIRRPDAGLAAAYKAEKIDYLANEIAKIQDTLLHVMNLLEQPNSVITELTNSRNSLETWMKYMRGDLDMASASLDGLTDGQLAADRSINELSGVVQELRMITPGLAAQSERFGQMLAEAQQHQEVMETRLLLAEQSLGDLQHRLKTGVEELQAELDRVLADAEKRLAAHAGTRRAEVEKIEARTALLEEEFSHVDELFRTLAQEQTAHVGRRIAELKQQLVAQARADLLDLDAAAARADGMDRRLAEQSERLGLMFAKARENEGTTEARLLRTERALRKLQLQFKTRVAKPPSAVRRPSG